jgi:hypothetical protein
MNMDRNNTFFGRDGLWNFIANFTMAANNFAIFVLAFYASVTAIFFYLTSKRVVGGYAWLVWLLFLCVIFPMSLNTVRQVASVSVIIYVSATFVQGLQNGKIRKERFSTWAAYIVLSIFAILLHNTSVIALLYIPIYIAANRLTCLNKYIKAFLTIVLAVVMGFATVAGIWWALGFITDIPGFEKYISHFRKVGSTPNLLFAVAPILVVFPIVGQATKTTINRFLLVSSIVYTILTLTLYTFLPFGYRLAVYFMPMYFLLFALLAQTYTQRNHALLHKLIAYGLIIMWSAGFFILSIYRNGSHDLFPYQFIWNAV